MKRKTSKIPKFADQVVIYHSQEDGCWIAHSLRTDQIGTGDHIVNALADLIRGVFALLRLAEKDETINYLREAPGDVQKLSSRSKKLPGEIFEVAYKRATGTWPEEWSVPDPKESAGSFTTEIDQDLAMAMERVGF